jgi:hypothetical protein
MHSYKKRKLEKVSYINTKPFFILVGKGTNIFFLNEMVNHGALYNFIIRVSV